MWAMADFPRFPVEYAVYIIIIILILLSVCYIDKFVYLLLLPGTAFTRMRFRLIFYWEVIVLLCGTG